MGCSLIGTIIDTIIGPIFKQTDTYLSDDNFVDEFIIRENISFSLKLEGKTDTIDNLIAVNMLSDECGVYPKFNVDNNGKFVDDEFVQKIFDTKTVTGCNDFYKMYNYIKTKKHGCKI